MATAASGFAYQLPDPRTLEFFGKPRLNVGIPETATWVASRTNEYVQTMRRAIVEALRPVNDQLPRDECTAQKVFYPPLQQFAIDTQQSPLAIYQQVVRAQICKLYQAVMGLKPEAAQALTVGTQVEMHPPQELVANLQKEHPEWTEERCFKTAIEISLLATVSPSLIANALELTSTDWNPSTDYATFVKCLKEGPMLVLGEFGPESYQSAPVLIENQFVLNHPVYKWPKGTARVANHLCAIAIVGVPGAGDSSQQCVYFCQIDHPEKIFVISYQNLQAHVSSFIRPIREELRLYTIYAFQNRALKGSHVAV